MKLLTMVRQVLKPFRVSILATPDENLPYSAAYGFGITSTESTASIGRSKPASPVDGSLT